MLSSLALGILLEVGYINPSLSANGNWRQDGLPVSTVSKPNLGFKVGVDGGKWAAGYADLGKFSSYCLCVSDENYDLKNKRVIDPTEKTVSFEGKGHLRGLFAEYEWIRYNPFWLRTGGFLFKPDWTVDVGKVQGHEWHSYGGDEKGGGTVSSNPSPRLAPYISVGVQKGNISGIFSVYFNLGSSGAKDGSGQYQTLWGNTLYMISIRHVFK